MIYLSQLLGNPVMDSQGEKIGVVSDLGIATGEVFPRITSLAFMGPGRTPLMISWRKYVESYDEDTITLKVPSTEIRFSYLQPNEVLLARDILNKQIVDTRGIRVVRVNDLKLSDTSSTQLRLLGAEVGVRGQLVAKARNHRNPRRPRHGSPHTGAHHRMELYGLGGTRSFQRQAVRFTQNP